MSNVPTKDEQLDIMKQRLLAGGMDRRQVLKVAAAAAGAAAVGIAGASTASAARVGNRSLHGYTKQEGEEQVFYNFLLTEDPRSFDFNLDLYCGGSQSSFAGLLTFDADLNAVADWAEEFMPNEDASVWTFKIRQNNTGWSDGKPVTAGDFVWSWKRQLDPANAAAYAGFLFDIKNAEKINAGEVAVDELGVVAVDDWTLEVTCEGPRAYFPQVVAYIAAVPSPQWKVEELGAEWALGNNGNPIVTNGPFNPTEWEKGVVVRSVKNEGYWDAANISITKLIEPVIPADNLLLAYEQGEGEQQLDWTNLSKSDFERYSADPVLAEQISPYVYPGIWMLLPSNGVAPFDNPAVLKALSHSIDRQRLSDVTGGLVVPAYCMVPAGVYGYLDDPSLQEIQKFDPEAAMAALAGTEFEGGQNWPEINMWMRAQEEVYNADIMANDIAAQLKEVLGMDIKINPVPQANFRDQLFTNTWQLVFIRWWLDYPDPNNCYGDMFYSRKTSGKRQAWSNDQFDDLVNAAKAEPDPEKRLAMYLELETIIQTEIGYMPLTFRLDNYVFKPWVKNVPVNSQGYQVPDGNIFVRSTSSITIEGRA